MPVLELSPDVPAASLKRLFVRGKVLGVSFRCLVISDGFPHWLLALRQMVLDLNPLDAVGGCSSAPITLLESFLPLLQKVLISTAFDDSKFSTLVESVDVLLFSGSDASLTQLPSFSYSVPTMCIPRDPTAALRRATLAKSGLHSHRWRHRMLGGVTNGSLQAGCRHINFSAFKPPL